MSKYKLIVFDLDGTLLDTTEGILKSVKETLIHFQLDEIKDDVIQSFIGPPIQNSLEKYCGLKGALLQEATDYFRTTYSGENLFHAKVYEGIYELLLYLKNCGITSSVATYKREDYAIRLLRSFHFDDYTPIFYGADNFNKLKKEDIILKCIDRAEIKDFSKILMVGDTIHDSMGAEKLGIDFLGVTYGFGFKNEEDCIDLKCIAVVDSPLKIINAINSQI